MKLKPLNDGVLLVVDKVSDKTATGVYLTEAMKKDLSSRINKPLYIVGVGENVKNVKVGERVLLRANSTVMILDEYDCGVEGKEYAMVSSHACLAVVEEFN